MMVDTSIILVYCFLYMASTLINCHELELSGIQTVNYGSRQKLTCYKGGLWGISDVAFYRNGEEFAGVGRRPRCSLFKANQDQDNLDKDCSWWTRTLIINKVDNVYNNTVWWCLDKEGVSNSFTLKVKDVSPCNGFIASISGNVNVVEGDDLHLTCDSNVADDDNFKYSWAIYDNNGSSTNVGEKTIDKTASKGDTGMYSCQIKKDDCFSEAQKNIKVQYHPTVSIHSESSSTINITCIGDGYPDNFTFYGWHHYINDQLVRVLRGNETRGSTVLILERVTALDNGKYVCLLSNSIPDKDGNLNSSAEYTVNIPAAPITIGNKVKEIDINTEDNVNMTKDKRRELSPLDVSDVVQEEYTGIDVYGTTVNVSVSVVQYSIQNVPIEGHYYFNVCNVHKLCTVSYGYNITFNSKEPLSGMNDKEEQGQDLPIILGTVAAVAVVLVIVIIAIVVVRRRSSTSKLNNTNYDQQDNSRSNPIYDERNVEIIPNELYQSSDPKENNTQMDPKPDTNLTNMEIIPNELYISAGAENQSRDQDTDGLKKATPDELYVDGETIAKNKEIQRQIKSSYADNDQVYVNDSVK